MSTPLHPRHHDLERVLRLLRQEQERLRVLTQAPAAGQDSAAEIAALRAHVDVLKDLAEAVRARIARDMQPVPPAFFRRHDHSILVVDDHEATRYGITRALRAHGYQTMEASAGAEALELSQYASALVLDVGLPDLHGFEVCRLVRQDERTHTMPIVHVSAIHRSMADVNTSREVGADDFMLCPVDFPVLTQRLDSLLVQRGARA